MNTLIEYFSSNTFIYQIHTICMNEIPKSEIHDFRMSKIKQELARCRSQFRLIDTDRQNEKTLYRLLYAIKEIEAYVEDEIEYYEEIACIA